MPMASCEPQLKTKSCTIATQSLEPCEGASNDRGHSKQRMTTDSKCPVSEQAQIQLGCWEEFYFHFLLSCFEEAKKTTEDQIIVITS